MKFTDIKEHLKNSAKEIRAAKCEAKCANRLAHFKSYDRHGVPQGLWGWGWNTTPDEVSKHWSDFARSKNSLRAMQETYRAEFAAYCIMRCRTLQEIFPGTKYDYLLSESFQSWVDSIIKNWEDQLEVKNEENVCSCEG